MPEHLDRTRVGQALDGIAGNTSRRGFIARLGGAMMAATAGSVVGRAIEPGEADAYHFCGHTFTTGSCVHPQGPSLPRIDRDGWPIDAASGKPIDNLGRIINKKGLPVDGDGNVLQDPDGRPMPPAPRTKVCDETARQYGINAQIDGAWYRCCGGTVRKLVDCCSQSNRRINGDASLTGYCYQGRKVFCVMYYQTKVPC
jgi:hypothetical protein